MALSYRYHLLGFCEPPFSRQSCSTEHMYTSSSWTSSSFLLEEFCGMSDVCKSACTSTRSKACLSILCWSIVKCSKHKYVIGGHVCCRFSGTQTCSSSLCWSIVEWSPYILQWATRYAATFWDPKSAWAPCVEALWNAMQTGAWRMHLTFQDAILLQYLGLFHECFLLSYTTILVRGIMWQSLSTNKIQFQGTPLAWLWHPDMQAQNLVESHI